MCSTRDSTGTLLLILDIRVREPLEILGTTVHTTHELLTWIDLFFCPEYTRPLWSHRHHVFYHVRSGRLAK